MFATLIGWVVFGAFPDAWTLAGMAVIALSGLFITLMQQRRARKEPITPEQALANTRALLEAKREHDRQPPPWQALDPGHGHAPAETGGQVAGGGSGPGDAGAQAIHGGIGSQGRHDQGKRDNRS